jgi:hypothetical protein
MVQRPPDEPLNRPVFHLARTKPVVLLPDAWRGHPARVCFISPA